jgi:hypothetical protein
MTTAYTSLLGLALPVTGELSGTWGDTVNNSITSLLDSAIAGTQTITADTTLTTTTGAANQSRQAILLCSPASVNITVTAPAQSKIYTVINTSAVYTVKICGVGPTTGVTLGVSEKAVVAWNGSDFIKISNTAGAGTFTNLTVTGVADFADGTVSLPSITNTGDTNTGIFFPAADTIAFTEGGVESMRIDSAGNVGIGTSSPTALLDIVGTSATEQFRIGNTTGDTDFGITVRENLSAIINSAEGVTGRGIQFQSGGTNTLLIDSSGNLGLAVTPSAWSTASTGRAIEVGPAGSLSARGTTTVEVAGNAYYDGTNWIYRNTNTASNYTQSAGIHSWNTAASGTAGNTITFSESMRIDSSGNVGIGTSSPREQLDVVGDIVTSRYLLNDVGGTGRLALEIDSNNDTKLTTGTTSETRSLVLYTENAERARIDSSGNLLVGQTSNSNSAKIAFTHTSVSSNGLVISDTRTSGSGAQVYFIYNGSNVGSISSTSVATLYNTTSDQRLKENIVDAAPASALIDALQVREYDWKSDGSHQRYGFIAQELVTVAPEAVHQPADPEEMMSVDYSKLVPMLVKEIQSLRARLAAANL